MTSRTRANIFTSRITRPRREGKDYREAADLAARLEMAPLLAQCHLGLGQLCLARGEHAPGQKHLERAYTLFHELGMPASVATR